MEDFEWWEAHEELHELQDYPALVDLCEREVAAAPGELHAIERLAEAYLLNGEPQKVLEVVGPVHERYPELDSFAHTLLRALFALGIGEDDYRWAKRPTILRLGPEVADACYQKLKPKRKPVAIYEVYGTLEGSAFLDFSEEELLGYLRGDERFVVEEDGIPILARVKVKRKSRRR